MMTNKNIDLSNNMFNKYLSSLVGQFYKILPLKESGEKSLGKYIDSLQREMLGCYDLIILLDNDELYLSLLSILEYLKENDCETEIVKREVFKAISICKKLHKKYFVEEV